MNEGEVAVLIWKARIAEAKAAYDDIIGMQDHKVFGCHETARMLVQYERDSICRYVWASVLSRSDSKMVSKGASDGIRENAQASKD